MLDLSGPYRAAFNAALPDAKQVADPFHVVRLANDALDEVRRRVQNQTLGHRGHKHDPLYRARKLLVSASENITDNGHTKLRGLLDAGDPYGEVRDAWHAKETLRGIYDIDDAKVGAATVNQLAQDLQDPAMPPEINRLGRTIWNWRHQISNWHAARVTNAPTEAVNNLVKRVKRAAFGFTNFANYRIRALLYAGKPNWALLDTLTPDLKREEPGIRWSFHLPTCCTSSVCAPDLVSGGREPPLYLVERLWRGSVGAGCSPRRVGLYPPCHIDGPGGVAEKVEAGVLGLVTALRVFAVQVLRLVGMQLKAQGPEPLSSC